MTIHSRETEIEKEEIEVVVSGQGHRVAAGGHGDGRVTVARKPFSRNDTMRSSSSAMRILVMGGPLSVAPGSGWSGGC